MNHIIFLAACILFAICSLQINAQNPGKQTTICNPMNLNYRFQTTHGKGLSYREAADPSMTMYKGKYFLYASHSGGYWISDDMLDWKFIPIKTLEIEDYAPDVITLNDTTYYMASSGTMMARCLCIGDVQTVSQSKSFNSTGRCSRLLNQK